MQSIVEIQSAKANDPERATMFSAMTADSPLYNKMLHVLRNSPDGLRNPEFSRIIVLLRHMHQAVAYQDVVKFIFWDAGTDNLAPGGGLSSSLIDIFRKRKTTKRTCDYFGGLWLHE